MKNENQLKKFTENIIEEYEEFDSIDMGEAINENILDFCPCNFIYTTESLVHMYEILKSIIMGTANGDSNEGSIQFMYYYLHSKKFTDHDNVDWPGEITEEGLEFYETLEVYFNKVIRDNADDGYENVFLKSLLK